MPNSQRDKKNKISPQALQKYQAEFLSEVIDVARKANVQRAVDYFVSDKIVCSTFEKATQLQREARCTNIVTYDGTEFKQGMVSGGQHTSNIFNLNLGQAELDRDIKKLSAKISKMSATLETNKNAFKEATSNEAQLSRDISKIELEIENLNS